MPNKADGRDAVNKVSLIVEPVCIPYSKKYLGKLQLHVLQEKVYDLVNLGKNVLLHSPTGSGKTLTLLFATDYGGAVGIYPNNTLLLNQRDSLGDIITKYSNMGECIGYYDTEKREYREGCPSHTPNSPMIIYRIKDRGNIKEYERYEHIVLFTLSSKTIEEHTESPKREIIYRLAEKAHTFKNPYIVTLTTPDTFLLLYSGAYRDFENVGKLLHNLLTRIAEGTNARKMENELRRSGTVTRKVVAPIIGIKARLLEFPLFIDEFHLYGPYELDALYAILKLNKEASLEEYPIVFSSATPAMDTLKTFEDTLKLEYELATHTHEGGCDNGFRVRGRTEVEIVGVDTSYKGLGAYYRVGDSVPEILIDNYLNAITTSAKRGKNVLVVLDRVYQVYHTVDAFVSNGLSPIRCYASIPHPECDEEGNIIVGAQRITQGVNIDDVEFMASTAVSVEDAVQRFGRSGRRGSNSRVVLFAPRNSVESISGYGGKTISYNEFVSNVLAQLYSDVTNRQIDATKNFDRLHDIRKRMLYAISITSIARVSGQHRIFEKVVNEIDRNTARFVSEKFVFGDPLTYAMLLKFRRTGFRVKYRIAYSRDTKLSEEDIGIIIRNAKIEKVEGELLTIDPKNAPRTIRERDIVVLDASAIKNRLIKGKITRLNYLRDRGAKVKILNSETKPVSDVLLYILRTPPSQDIVSFLVQTGNAIFVDFGRSFTLALFL